MPVWTGAENLAPNGIRSPDRRYKHSYHFLATEAKENCFKYNWMQPDDSKFVTQRADRGAGEWKFGWGWTLYNGDNL